MESFFLKIATKTFFIQLLLICSLPLHSQTIPIGGQDLIRSQALKNIHYEKQGMGVATVVSATPDSSVVLSLKTLTQPPFIYNLALNFPLKKQKLLKEQVLLLSFQARTVSSSLETGEAKCLWLLRQSDSHKESLERSVSLASDWRTYYFPIQTTQAIKADDLALVIQFGYPPQELLLRDLQLLIYPAETDINSLPKTQISYAGQEPDAPWRKAAKERIEKHRKGDFQLNFMDKKGNPLRKVAVQVKQKKHYFSWGAAVSAQDLINDPKHIEHFRQAFNLAVFENDLKIKRWNKNDNQAVLVTRALQVLEENDIDIKGHVLIWPGFRYLPPIYKRHQDNPKKITKLLNQHLDAVLNTTRNKISRWDVVNEAYTNQDLQRITGSEEILYEGFRKLKQKEPQVLRYTNEYGIISKGGHDSQKQAWYYDFIKRIDQHTGGLVDGIGIQCHIGTDLTPPERVLEILDYYSELDKKIAISELTLEIKDPEIRKQYTLDFITAAFSHPSVFELLFWGYYEPKHEKAAIFSENWELAPMGEAFFSLVHDEWKTNIIAETDSTGSIKGRGFYGLYEYTFVMGNQVVKGEFSVSPGETEIIKIKIP
ncbi:MAG: hypothetical protein DHS20C18_29530 [Saprospiraceae bacterium]|nr:MAG: hypothetical protein DHS20C18_29530 [Saprospiraceae bacterium]